MSKSSQVLNAALNNKQSRVTVVGRASTITSFIVATAVIVGVAVSDTAVSAEIIEVNPIIESVDIFAKANAALVVQYGAGTADEIRILVTEIGEQEANSLVIPVSDKPLLIDAWVAKNISFYESDVISDVSSLLVVRSDAVKSFYDNAVRTEQIMTANLSIESSEVHGKAFDAFSEMLDAHYPAHHQALADFLLRNESVVALLKQDYLNSLVTTLEAKGVQYLSISRLKVEMGRESSYTEPVEPLSSSDHLIPRG